MVTSWQQDRVGAALRGDNPTVLRQLGPRHDDLRLELDAELDRLVRT